MYHSDVKTPSSGKSRYAVLGLLSIRPMSGYDMKQTVEQSLAHFWSESYGSIYPLLRRLAEEGLVQRTAEKGSRGASRFVYSLTPSGRDELARWLAAPTEDEPPIRSELLLKLFFGNHLAPLQVRSLIADFEESQRRRLERLRAGEAEINRRRAEAGAFYWLLTLRRGVLIAEARIQWANEVIAQLDAIERRRRRRPSPRATPARPRARVRSKGE